MLTEPMLVNVEAVAIVKTSSFIDVTFCEALFLIPRWQDNQR